MTVELLKARVGKVLNTGAWAISRDNAQALLDALNAAETDRDNWRTGFYKLMGDMERRAATEIDEYKHRCKVSDGACAIAEQQRDHWMQRAKAAEGEIARRDAAASEPADRIVDDGCGQQIGGVGVSDRLNCVWPIGTKFYTNAPPDGEEEEPDDKALCYQCGEETRQRLVGDEWHCKACHAVQCERVRCESCGKTCTRPDGAHYCHGGGDAQ